MWWFLIGWMLGDDSGRASARRRATRPAPRERTFADWRPPRVERPAFGPPAPVRRWPGVVERVLTFAAMTAALWAVLLTFGYQGWSAVAWSLLLAGVAVWFTAAWEATR